VLLRRLLRPLWVLVAVVFLVEGWLWSHLAALVGRLVAALGLPAWKDRLAVAVERLPPAAALLVFLIPVLLLLPVKFLGLWLLAHGHWLGALGVLATAKVVGMGVTAFIFQATRPRLLQMGWFRWVYTRVLGALGWAHRQIDPIKARVRLWARVTVGPVVERVRAAWHRWRARPHGRLVRKLLRLRRRTHRV
jgi:hypothetical protein